MAFHLNITTNARNEFCANLTIQPNVIYWAVLRLENDEDVNREIFPPVETGLYSISIIIYLIIMGFSIYILITVRFHEWSCLMKFSLIFFFFFLNF